MAGGRAMTCARVCLTCKSAGLAECPFKAGVALPLAPAPKVEYRRPKVVWIPPGVTLEEAERIIDSVYGPRK